MSFKKIALGFFVFGITLSVYLFWTSYQTHREINTLAQRGILERLTAVAERK